MRVHGYRRALSRSGDAVLAIRVSDENVGVLRRDACVEELSRHGGDGPCQVHALHYFDVYGAQALSRVVPILPQIDLVCQTNVAAGELSVERIVVIKFKASTRSIRVWGEVVITQDVLVDCFGWEAARGLARNSHSDGGIFDQGRARRCGPASDVHRSHPLARVVLDADFDLQGLPNLQAGAVH